MSWHGELGGRWPVCRKPHCCQPTHGQDRGLLQPLLEAHRRQVGQAARPSGPRGGALLLPHAAADGRRLQGGAHQGHSVRQRRAPVLPWGVRVRLRRRRGHREVQLQHAVRDDLLLPRHCRRQAVAAGPHASAGAGSRAALALPGGHASEASAPQAVALHAPGQSPAAGARDSTDGVIRVAAHACTYTAVGPASRLLQGLWPVWG
mmetsp:Transcript_74153/g.230588  ORF Transcript_74153/g.230588 Transcript_74153/m.230588 type:complete len:205 (+) Transcript_74153:596-1210(+)